MGWNDVYTTSQRAKLFGLTLDAFEQFMARLPETAGEIGIAGIYGETADKLVLKDGRLFEKRWSYESSQYKYSPVEMGMELVSYYRLTPTHFDEARKRIETRRHEHEEKERQLKERQHVYQELKALCASPAARELIRHVSFSGSTLILTRDGLIEKTLTGTRMIMEDGFLDAITKYKLTLDDLRNVRRKIET